MYMQAHFFAFLFHMKKQQFSQNIITWTMKKTYIKTLSVISKQIHYNNLIF